MPTGFTLLGKVLLAAVALTAPARAWAACGLPTQANLPEARHEALHALDIQDRRLEAARADIKRKRAAYDAATAELSKNPGESSTNQLRVAAAALREAEDARRKADERWRAANQHLDCILRQMWWAVSITAPARAAGGAGQRLLLGAGLRLNVRTASSPRELHSIGADYLSLNNFGFDEREYEPAGDSQRALSIYYAYRYKNFIVSPAAALRVSDRDNDGLVTHPNAWLIGRIAFDIDNELSLPRVCSTNCFVASGNLFIEPWFPIGQDVPVSVLFGAEIAFGVGLGVGD